MKRLLISFGILSFTFLLSACNQDVAKTSTPFNVTFLDDDGTFIAFFEVMPGENSPVPEDPFKEGYVFERWSEVARNVNRDLDIKAMYNPLERIIEPTILVLTYIEGIESTLEDFFNLPIEIVRSFEGLVLSEYVRVLVLYDDALRRDLHPSRIGAPLVREDQFLTFAHAKGVEMTLVYLKDISEYKTFFEVLDDNLFDLQGIQIAYEFYPLEGTTVYVSSSMYDAQRLIDLLDGARLASKEDELRWFTTSQEIYIFIGEIIPSFLSAYAENIRLINKQVTEIMTDRGQRLIIGRSTLNFVEYFESYLSLIESGIKGTMTLESYRPERFSLPQTKISNADICKIRDFRDSNYLGQNLPHPTTVSHDISQNRIPSIGTLFGLVVMIRFNEIDMIISDADYLSIIEDAIIGSDEFYSEMSNGGLSFEWTYHPNVVSVPFFLNENINAGTPGYMDLVNEHIEKVLEEVEKSSDLSDIDFINFFWPPGLPSYVGGGLAGVLNEPLDTKNGTIYNYILQTVPENDSDYLTHVVRHELAHALGLTDTYIHPWVKDFERQIYLEWDLMATIDFEFNAWHRWLLSWMDDEQIFCLPSVSQGEYEIFLEPLNENDAEIRQIVINLSETEAISIELRGPGTYCPRNCNQNILVTYIDSSISGGNGPKKIIGSSRFNGANFSHAPLLEGNSITFRNITILHSERYGSGSVVKIRFDE